ncbi:MAG: glucose-6-phosphate isomerase [Chromatiales bacterium]
MDITTSQAWQRLGEHHDRVVGLHMRELFGSDPERYGRFALECDDLFLDYSKNRIVPETMERLLALARAAEVEAAREAMFAGDTINHTEHRAALHTALRNFGDKAVHVDGEDVMPRVRGVLARMRTLVETVTSGQWRGHNGARITDVVNIGIGGSHLGPFMASEALRPHHQAGLRVHYVSNADPSDIALTLAGLDPASTLFIVVSKTFTTLETSANAAVAKAWLMQRFGEERAIADHVVAVSSDLEAARAFGVGTANVLEMWDWVGGRYSLWSAVGLSTALAVGMDAFLDLLRGGWQMDNHFRSAPLETNLPIILGLLGVWYHNFFGAESHCVVPYEELLKHLPAHLQQLDMESNGKRAQRDGHLLPVTTAPVIWGGTGTNTQHAFFQLLHQGGRVIPVDFLLGLASPCPLGEQHDLLGANCFAQSEALMRGRTLEETAAEMLKAGMASDRVRLLAPHRVFPGNNPSNTLLYSKLTPRVLGQLIALYEHKVFVQGVIWGVNSFDQWGVELGKQLATTILGEFRGDNAPAHDASTSGLIARFRGRPRQGTTD